MPRSKLVYITEHKIQSLAEEMRPPVDIRKELDMGYSFDGSELILFDIRPFWDNPQKIIESPFAKGRFIKSKGIWKVYWIRGNGKWYPYDPHPEVSNVEKFFAIVDEDQYGCFKG